MHAKIFTEFQLEIQGFGKDRNHKEVSDSEIVSRKSSVAKRYSIRDFFNMEEE